MGELEDDDFSELYADVEVQAFSALSSLHRLTEMPPGSDRDFANDTGGDEKDGDERGGLTNLPMEEDGDVSDSDNGNKQRLDGNFGSVDSNVEFGAANMKKHGGTNGTEKNLDSLDSKERRLYEMAPQVQKNGDADMDLCVRRANEDNRPTKEKNGAKIASERVSSHDRAYGSVQLSDVSECDSDRTPKGIDTSNYKTRRNTSSVSNSEPSTVGPELSSQSEQTRHDPCSSRSRSPYASLSDDSVKSPSSRNPSYEKPFRKDLNQHKKYNDTPDRKSRLTGDDESYVSDVKWRAMRSFYSNEKDFRRYGHGMSERRVPVGKCRETSYEAREDEWHYNRRRHVMGNSDHVQKEIPKCHYAVGTRGARFCNRGGYGKYRRFMPSSRYDRNIACDRREMESFEISKRWRDNNFLDNSHKLRYLETYGVRERNMRCQWEKTDINDHLVRRGNYKKPTNAYVMNENMRGHQDRDHFFMRRHHQQFKSLRSNGEAYKHRHHSEGQSHHFERISRNHKGDSDRRAFGCVAELIDEREVGRQRFKMTRGDRSNRFDECRKFIQPQRNPDSFDPNMDIEGRKCIQQRMFEAANDKHYGRHDDGVMEWNVYQKCKYFEDTDDYMTEKVVLTNEGKIDDFNQNESLDIEDGQIITEDIYEDPLKCGIAEEDVNLNGNGVIEGLGDDKIREIMGKMEKRKERFKEPVKSSRDFENISNQLLDLDVKTDKKGTLERPTRKRRWF